MPIRSIPRLAAVAACAAFAGCAAPGEPGPAYRIENDAIPEPLAAGPADPRRGREIFTGREANCLFCHSVPEPGQRYMGNVGPPLAGVSTRLTPGQMRLRIADPTRVNREAVMPAYYRIEGLNNVAEPHRGKPILSARDIEDVIAYLQTLN